MIDRGDIRQAIDRCSNIWASLPGAGYGQFEHKDWQPDCKIQRSGRNGQRLMYEQSHHDYLRSWLSASSSRCLSWAVNHYRDNAITYKAQRDKKCRRELKLTRGNYWHADACVAALDAKYRRCDAKAENDALRDDVAAGRRRLRIKAICRISAMKATTASGVDNAASPRLADITGEIISPSETDPMQKQLEEPRKLY